MLGETETVMAGSVDTVVAAAAPLPDGHTMARADDEDSIREAESVAARVFGDTDEASRERADARVAAWRADPDAFEVWLVRDASGAAVCSGRVEITEPEDNGFACLQGGCCLEEHRGKGLYRALVAARAHAARERAKAYVQADCTAGLRPILERAGLIALTTTTLAVWHRP